MVMGITHTDIIIRIPITGITGRIGTMVIIGLTTTGTVDIAITATATTVILTVIIGNKIR
jgi:hypothetical protein